MAPKIFITGITGYTGGTVFDQLVKRHPEYDLTAFVRKTPADFEKTFPNVKLVHGTWDDSAILRKAASEADVVVQCGNSDHLGAVSALLEGAAEGARKRGGGAKAWYIHLGGTAIIADFTEPNAKSFRGKLNPKRFSDIADVAEVTSRPDGLPHRHTDKAILKAGTEQSDVLGTAIVCPPDMYGKGTGPVKVESVYVPAFVGEAKKFGGAFYYGEGANTRGWAHVIDAAEVFVRLVEEAVQGGGSATWGREGYYFTTTQEASQKDLAAAVAKKLHKEGVLPSAEAKQVDEGVIDKALESWGWDGLGWYMFGNNSRAKAERAEKELGWKATQKTLWEEIEGDIERALGSGYAGQTDLIKG